MIISSRNRLIFSLTLILVAAFLLIETLNFNNARTTLHQEISQSTLPLLRDNIFSEIQKDFLPAVNISSMMGTDSFLETWTIQGEKDINEIIKYLSTIKDTYGYKSTFFVSETTGNYYNFDGVLKKISRNVPHDSWYFDFKASGKAYDLDVDTDEAADHRLTIFINHQVRDADGRFLGIAGVGILMQDFSGFLETQQQKFSRQIFLTDKFGVIQAHSDSSKVLNTTLTEIPGMSKAAAELLSHTADPFNTEYDGEKGTILLTARYIPEIDWFLIVEQEEDSLLSSTRSNLAITTLIGIGASLLILLLSFITINSYNRQLEELATTDSLTGSANRRELERHMGKMVSRQERNGNKITLVLIDLDNFKKLNDSLGHQAGDNVLKTFTRLTNENLRPDDLLARWGGDEFVILLETGKAEARAVAERLRYFFSQYWNKEHQNSPRVSLSMGIVEKTPEDTLPSLIEKADNALYYAKRSGKDRITVYQD